jgi:hypothetical protein
MVLGVVSRYSISAIGLLYAVGLVIVNADLASFGLVSLDLARPEYVFAGILWAFISLPLQLIGILAVFSVKSRRLPDLRYRRLHLSRRFQLHLSRILLFFFFGLMLPLVIVALVADFPSPSVPHTFTIRRLFGVGANNGDCGRICIPFVSRCCNTE